MVTLMYFAKIAAEAGQLMGDLTHCRSKEPCIRWGQDPPTGMGNFWGLSSPLKHWESAAVYAAKSAAVYAAKGIIQSTIMMCIQTTVTS